MYTGTNLFVLLQQITVVFLVYYFLFSGYVPHPKESIGLQCKRLIDAGRVWYLRQCGYEAEQCHYVDKNISLENNLIIATC